MGSKVKRRACRRRRQGQRIMMHVQSCQIDSNKLVGVTAARKYINQNNIKPPFVVNVRRNAFTVDRYFWSESGMYSLGYAEFNWMVFPCLRKIVSQVGSEKIFADMREIDWAVEEESYKPEYVFGNQYIFM